MNIRLKIMAVGLALVAAVLALAATNWRSTSDEAVRAPTSSLTAPTLKDL